MATIKEENDTSFFTVISKEVMDYVDNVVDQQEPANSETQIVNKTPSLATNVNCVSLKSSDQNRHKKWMKLESCVNNCHLRISEDDQKNIFDNYWQNSTVSSRYRFINDMTQLSSIKESDKHNVVSIGENVFFTVFSLNTFKGSKNVCKSCFRSILGEDESFIKAVIVQKNQLHNASGLREGNLETNQDENDQIIDSRVLIINKLVPCRMKCHFLLSFKDQKQILHDYWHKTTIEQRCKFISDRTEIRENEKYKNNSSNSKKPYYSTFFLNTDKGRESVCPNCFQIILKEESSIILEVLDEKWSKVSSELENGEKYNEVVQHVNKFPLFESHHVSDCRTGKYLPIGLTLQMMYDLYRDQASNPVSLNTYKRIFTKTGVQFLTSTLEICSHCETATQQSKSSDLFKEKIRLESFINSHLNASHKAHTFKSRDEKKKAQTQMVCTFKFHDSLPAPFLNQPNSYYKQPIWSYNFTITEVSQIRSNSGSFKSYVWDETHGQKSVNEMGTCLHKYLEDLPPNIRTVIFYSTSCNGQSRSKLLCSILSNLVVNHKTLTAIEHKFLLDGHFYEDKNKTDDWCRDILNERIGNIEEPQDWFNALSERAEKYNSEVVVMNSDMFYDFKGHLGGFFEGWMDGGIIDDDVTCILYTKNGTISFKRKWVGIYETMQSYNDFESQCINFCKEDLNRIQRISLTKEKKNDLLDLFPSLSPRVYDYYSNLPAENSPSLNENSSTVEIIPESSNYTPGKITILSSDKLNEITQSGISLDKESKSNSENLCKTEEVEISPEFCVVKEEFDPDCEKKFSDDEMEEEMESNQTEEEMELNETEEEMELSQTDNFVESSETGQSSDKRQVPVPNLFSTNHASKIEAFNMKFYQNDNYINIGKILSDSENTSNREESLTSDNTKNNCNPGLNFLRQMKTYQLLSHCPNLCYLKVTPKDQERIFTMYWYLGTGESRFKFLYEMIKFEPKNSGKSLDNNMEFSVKFCLETDHGPQNVCKFCFTKVLSERETDIVTVLKLKSQAFFEGLKAEVQKVENSSDKSSNPISEIENFRIQTVSNWKAAEFDCPSSKLLRNEKLQKCLIRLQPCRNGCFLTISKADQVQVYHNYWQGATFHSRFHFIHASTKKTLEKTNVWRKYYLYTNKGPQRVCKRCFCLGLGETVKFVESVLRRKTIPFRTKSIKTTMVETVKRILQSQGTNSKNISISQTNADVSDSKSVVNTISQTPKDPNQTSFKAPMEKSIKIVKPKEYPKVAPIEISPIEMRTPHSHQNVVPSSMIQQVKEVKEHIKKFLDSNINDSSVRISVQRMFADYISQFHKPLTIGWYQNILATSDVNFKPPFIDKCKECQSSADQFKSTDDPIMRDKISGFLTEHLNCSQLIYKYKFQEEESARLISSLMVCSFGFQQNFLIPSQNNENQPLAMFNLTIWQGSNNNVLNKPIFYIWPQVEGKRSANEIASCLFHYLKQYSNQLKSLIIYSSSCLGESRSKTLANMLSYVMTNHKTLVSVDHKFGYSGHSQLKEYLDNRWVDNIMKDSFIKTEEPLDWYSNFQDTVKLMNKKNFVFMEPDMFYDFERLWKEPSTEYDPYIDKQVMWLKYTKNGNIFYKKSLLERHNFEVLSVKDRCQFKDLLNLDLCNLYVDPEVNEKETPLDSLPSVPQEQSIIKTEIDFDEHYPGFDAQLEANVGEDKEGSSSKRRKLAETPALDYSRSKRIRKKKEIFSL